MHVTGTGASSTGGVEGETAIAGLRPDGAPDPAYAAALGLVRAPLGRRALGFVIEAAIAGVLLGAGPIVFALIAGDLTARLLAGSGAVDLTRAPGFPVALGITIGGGVLAVVFALVQLILHGRKGVTLGKAIVGIRSVNVASLERPGFGRVLLGSLTYLAAGAVPLGQAVLLASVLWDGTARSRSWIDRIRRTWLVDVRAGLNPYDEKAMRLARKAVAKPKVEDAAAVPSLATGVTAAAFTPAVRSRSSVIGAVPVAGTAAPAPVPGPSGASATPALVAEPTGSLTATPTSTATGNGSPSTAASGSWAPAAPAPVIAPPPSSTPSSLAAVLIADDGVRYDVAGEVLFGRNPSPRADEPGLAIRAVSDPGFSMSKTHAKVGVDAEGVWVEDRGSSNGTRLEVPGSMPAVLVPGERTRVPAQATLRMGDRAFTVQRE